MASPITSVALDQATPSQRRAYATTFLQLDVADTSSDDEVLSAIQRAQPNVTTIFAMDEAAPAPVEAPTNGGFVAPVNPVLRPEEQNRPTTGSLGHGDPRYIINIPVIDGDDTNDASQDVFVGVLGRAWQLRRGVDLNVPARVVEALKNTIATSYNHDDSGNETARDVKRIPYQTVEAPTAEQIADWHARTDHLLNP